LAAAIAAGSNTATAVTVASYGLVVVVASIAIARRDMLTWISVTYLAFATMLGQDVWGTQSGITRTVLPLYLLGAITIIGGLRSRQVGRSFAARHRVDDAGMRRAGGSPVGLPPSLGGSPA
jgi:hypothetical protein